MRISASIRNIFLIWLAWATIMIAFQQWIGMRVDLKRPDKVLQWTETETTSRSQNDKPYLMEPFLNQHVSWDSEYYLSIALAGYNDPIARAIPSDFGWEPMRNRYCDLTIEEDCVALSHAFFPLYSWITKIFVFPLNVFGLSSIATATLAAVFVSLLGALCGMVSLYAMSKKSLGEEGAVRCAFYFLIFPSGFFLAQVYTEGVFIGITFASLAFLTYRKWGWAAIFAALAVWARPGGALLVIPLGVIWFIERTWEKPNRQRLIHSGAVFAPVLSYIVWTITPLAEKFFQVESLYFGRHLLAVESSMAAWGTAFQSLLQNNSQTKFYYALEFSAVILAITACILLYQERPEIALFGLAMTIFTFTSGSAQGMIRYVLVVPAIFWVLARWGKNQAFDRSWTLLSILLMGVEVMLFSFDFWVA
jgi:hypothetical protein